MWCHHDVKTVKKKKKKKKNGKWRSLFLTVNFLGTSDFHWVCGKKFLELIVTHGKISLGLKKIKLKTHTHTHTHPHTPHPTHTHTPHTPPHAHIIFVIIEWVAPIFSSRYARIPIFERLPYPRRGTPCIASSLVSRKDGKTMFRGHFRKKKRAFKSGGKKPLTGGCNTPWLNKGKIR